MHKRAQLDRNSNSLSLLIASPARTGERDEVRGFEFEKITRHLIPSPMTRSLPLARPVRAFGFAKFLSPFPKRLKS
jgi:hypothetical protein